ncbi:MAG TPA: AsmA family protein, partial [Afifellaceae bacterium]|nr:AsmA family protein [Afifellaceae bacterium]
MKLSAAILAAIAAAIAGYFLLVSYLVSVDAARDHATRQLSAWTGRTASVGEQAELALFPSPRLVLHNLRIDSPDGGAGTELLSADTLQADIGILPLLIGRIRLGTLVLDDPKIQFVRDSGGKRNWRLDGGPAAVQLALSGDLPIDRLVLRNATIVYDNARRDTRETVLVPELKLDWEGIRQPASLTGSIRMREEDIAFRVDVESPLAFFDRKSTDFSAELKSPLLNANLDGRLADYKAAQFAGQIDASGPSLRRLIKFFGGKDSASPGLRAFALSGQAELKPDELFIDRGRVQLDENVASGNLTIALPEKKEKAKLTGTLAFPTLNLTPYLQAIGGGTGPLDWNERRIDTDWFDELNADVRLSAEQVIAGPYRFGGTAASAFLKDGMLEIGLAQSVFYGGVASGTISVTDLPGEKGQAAGVQLRATDFNFGQTITLAGGATDLGGKATMSISLETSGASLGEQAANLAGTTTIASLNG